MATVSATSFYTPSSTVTATNPNASLGESDFLELMLTQLKNQDPLEPMDTSEMSDQITQFSMLDQLEQMNASTTATQSYALLGMNVTYLYADETSGLTYQDSGVVTGVKSSDGVTYLEVNGNYIDMATVQKVAKSA